MRSSWTWNRVEELKLLLATDMTYRQIWAQLGMSAPAIYKAALTNGLIDPDRKSKTEQILKVKRDGRYERLGASNFATEEEYKIALRRYRIFFVKRSHARRRGIKFTLTFREIEWPEFCPVLGFRLDYNATVKYGLDNSPSFDRINPRKGYTPANTRVISNRANRLKNDGTLEELVAVAAYVATETAKSLKRL